MKWGISILLIFLVTIACSTTEEEQVINDVLESGQVTATRVLQIEDTEEDPFGSLGALATDSEGQIYVADNQLKFIRIYAADGSPIETVGREGKGPGEFTSINNLTVNPDEQKIWVYDVGQLRASLFTPQSDSTWVHDSQYSIESELGYPMNVHIANNRFIISSMKTVRDEDPQRLEISLQSAVIGDEAAKEKALTYTENEVVVPEASGEFVPIYSIPFSWRTHLQVDQSGSIYLGKSDSLRVRIFDTNGQQKQVIKNKIRYQPVTRQDIQEHGTEPSNPTYKLIPDYHPAFTEFRVDDTGRPWFNLGTLEDDMNTWVVLNNEGLMDASVVLPGTFDVKQIRGKNIYGINYSDTGRQAIMVYSLSDLN